MEVTTGFGTVKITMLKGEKGDRGRDGQGMPPGGVRGDVLTKNSSADYQTEWTTLPNATTTTDGLMSATDKASIDQTYTTGSSGQYLKKGSGRNVEWGAIPVVTERTNGLMLAADRLSCNKLFDLGSNGQYLTKGDGRTTTWKTLGNATTSAAGLMSAADKNNLNKLTSKDIARGTLACDITTAGEVQDFTKDFTTEMSAAPIVVLTPYRTSTREKGLHYMTMETTKSGFTVRVIATSTGKVQFHYIAVAAGVVYEEDNPPLQPTEV